MSDDLTLLDRACYFLADRPWTTCALICLTNLIAAMLSVVIP